MSDRDALLRTIDEQPDNTTPRLVYADWLEETGDPDAIALAEYIRLSCPETIRLGCPESWIPLAPTISDRRLKLWSGHFARWAPWWGLEQLERRPLLHFGFPCGYLIGQWLTQTPVEMAALQAIRGPRCLALENIPVDYPRFLRHPNVALISHLILNRLTGTHPLDPGVLYEGRRLAGIDKLELTGYRVEEAAWPEWIESGWWQRVRRVSMTACDLGNAGLAYLGDRLDAPKLVHLELPANQLSRQGMSHLTQGMLPRQLQILDLSNNPLGQLGIQQFNRTEWPALTALSLDHTILGYQGVAHLGTAACPNLHWLNLNANAIIDEGVDALIDTGVLSRLTGLWLANNRLTDVTLRRLAESEEARGLLILDLAGHRFSESALRRLYESPHLKQLECLRISAHPSVPHKVIHLLRKQYESALVMVP